MTKSRYDELMEAIEKRGRLYENYETECRNFITQLREGLINFLGCSEEQIQRVKFSEEEGEQSLYFKEIIEVTLDRFMALQKDAFYQFILRITFDSRWLDLNLRVKLVDEYFIVKLGKSEGKHKIQKTDQKDFDKLILNLFEIVKDYLGTDFEKFTHNKTSTLGFKPPK